MKQEVKDLKVEVILDTKENAYDWNYGIGMTQEEVNKYINEVAFSGAEEFLDNIKIKTLNLLLVILD